jgi:hypothetical protein
MSFQPESMTPSIFVFHFEVFKKPAIHFRDMQQQVKERKERVTVSRENSTAIGTLEETVDEVQPTELESGGDFQFETVDELTFGNCDDSDFQREEISILCIFFL